MIQTSLLAQEIVQRHLISPNLHVIMVHFPLGIFIFGLFLEVFSFLWRRSSVRTAGLWMIVFGGLLAVPAALSGIDALTDVTYNHILSPQAMALLHRHFVFAGWGAAMAAVLTTIAIGLSDRWRKLLYIPLLLGLIAAAGLMGFGSHFAGEGVYLRGIAVQMKGQAATGFEWYVPARSTHVLLAGLAIAMSLAALGTSMRVLCTFSCGASDDAEGEAALAELNAGMMQPEPRRASDDLTVARSLNDQTIVVAKRIPSARFWLLGALLFAITLGLGVWLLISQEDQTFLQNNKPTASSIWNEVVSTATATKPMKDNRRGAHVVIGVALFVLPLILALAVRFGPRRKWMVGSLCLLMVLLIAAEVWLGILLIHDQTEGPLYRFAPPDQAMIHVPVIGPNRVLL